jgi:hypothetical protein
MILVCPYLPVRANFPVWLDLRHHPFRVGTENEMDLLIVLFYFSPNFNSLWESFLLVKSTSFSNLSWVPSWKSPVFSGGIRRAGVYKVIDIIVLLTTMKKFCLVDNWVGIGRKNGTEAHSPLFAFGYNILYFMEVHCCSIFSQILAVMRASSRAHAIFDS